MNPIQGADWGCQQLQPIFFHHVDRGVILEDDCVPSDDFWPFMEFALNNFSDDLRVGSVSGNCFFPKEIYNFSFYYSHLNHIWGWGTWRRAWKSYNVSLQDDDKTIDSVLKSVFSEKFLHDQWLEHIQMAGKGQINTWDYQWTYTLWREGQVSINPAQNLVVNIGFDAEATHTVSTDFPGANLTYGSIKPPYVFPPTQAVAVDLDRKVLESHFRIEKPRPETITKKIKRLIKRFLGCNVART